MVVVTKDHRKLEVKLKQGTTVAMKKSLNNSINFSPRLPLDHGSNRNDLVYPEFPYNLLQVPITNFQQLHPDQCYPLH